MKLVEMTITADGRKSLVEKRCTKCNYLGLICTGVIKSQCIKGLFTQAELEQLAVAVQLEGRC